MLDVEMQPGAGRDKRDGLAFARISVYGAARSVGAVENDRGKPNKGRRRHRMPLSILCRASGGPIAGQCRR